MEGVCDQSRSLSTKRQTDKRLGLLDGGSGVGACQILKLRVIREGYQPSRRQLVEAVPVLVQSSMPQGVTRIKGSVASIITFFVTLP